MLVAGISIVSGGCWVEEWSPHTSDNDNDNGVHNQADNGKHPLLLGLVILCGLFVTSCYLTSASAVEVFYKRESG